MVKIFTKSKETSWPIRINAFLFGFSGLISLFSVLVASAAVIYEGSEITAVAVIGALILLAIAIFYIMIGWGLSEKSKWAYISAIVVISLEISLGALGLLLIFSGEPLEAGDGKIIILSLMGIFPLALLILGRKDFRKKL